MVEPNLSDDHVTIPFESIDEDRPKASTPRRTGSPGAEEILAGVTEETDFATFQQAASNFGELIKSGRELHATVSKSEEVDFEALIGMIEAVMDQTATLVSITNSLPEPDENRDGEIGKALLPAAILSWKKAAPAGNAALVRELYLKMHVTGEEKRPTIIAPDWLRGALPYLSISQQGEDFPEPEAYLQQSQQLSPKLKKILDEAAEINGKLQNLEEKNAKAQAKSGQSPFGDVIPGVRQNLETKLAEIPPLFKKLEDVLPEDVPEVVNALDVKVSAGPKILSEMLRATISLERVIVGASLAAGGSTLQTTELRVPLLLGGGKVEGFQLGLQSEELALLGNDSQKMRRLLAAYETGRSALRKTLLALRYGSGIAPDAKKRVSEVLTQPFSRYDGSGERTIQHLTGLEPRDHHEALCQLLQQPIATAPEDDRWGFVLESVKNAELQRWALSNYLSAEAEEQAERYAEFLKASATTADAVMGIARRARELLRKKDYGSLALHLREQIQEQTDTPEIHRSLGVFLIAGCLAADDEASVRLRYQIPNLDRMKEIANALAVAAPEQSGLFSTAVREVNRKLSASMVDFYRGDHAEELWQFLEKFRFLIDHPEILEGLSGNEAMRSGIILIGRPGVGKSYLAECLKNELGIKMFSISPENKREGESESMIDVAKRQIEGAKEYSKKSGACILFIDEAEAIAADREGSRTTPEQAELTDYILQETNEIRRKYPLILLLIATNYENRIDEAMLRDGRIDIHVYMEAPGPETRKAIIVDTIANQSIPVNLTEQQLDELVAISDGFMPLPVKRTLIEPHRIRREMVVADGKEFELTYEVLKEEFEAERSRYQRRIERQRARGSSFLRENQSGSESQPH